MLFLSGTLHGLLWSWKCSVKRPLLLLVLGLAGTFWNLLSWCFTAKSPGLWVLRGAWPHLQKAGCPTCLHLHLQHCTNWSAEFLRWTDCSFTVPNALILDFYFTIWNLQSRGSQGKLHKLSYDSLIIFWDFIACYTFFFRQNKCVLWGPDGAETILCVLGDFPLCCMYTKQGNKPVVIPQFM